MYKFNNGDDVTVTSSCKGTYIFPNYIDSYIGKKGTILKYEERLSRVVIEGDVVFIPNQFLVTNESIKEEQSLRELLQQNKDLLLNNRKAIDESLKLIDTMLNKIG